MCHHIAARCRGGDRHVKPTKLLLDLVSVIHVFTDEHSTSLSYHFSHMSWALSRLPSCTFTHCLSLRRSRFMHIPSFKRTDPRENTKQQKEIVNNVWNLCEDFHGHQASLAQSNHPTQVHHTYVSHLYTITLFTLRLFSVHGGSLFEQLRKYVFQSAKYNKLNLMFVSQHATVCLGEKGLSS